MTIIGLENNYYLSMNDIWITVNGFTENTYVMEVSITNLITGKSLSDLKLSPSPDNEFAFNICLPVRALFPFPDHTIHNTLQSFQFDFNVKFENSNTPDESTTLSKFFILGGRKKNGKAEWYLSASEELIVGTWLEWLDIPLPGFANRIQGSTIVDYVPTNKLVLKSASKCDYKILKFLNSLGGYQYYLFEKFQEKPKSKPGKIIMNPTDRLRQDNFRNIEITTETTIEFQAKTPFAAQSVITDLISSPEILMYDPSGEDNDSKWQRLVLENNDSIENNWDRVYQNKIEFSFSSYINKKI